MKQPKVNQNAETDKDFGSERLPTDTTQNRWDMPSGPDGIPPSERVAGGGATETSFGVIVNPDTIIARFVLDLSPGAEPDARQADVLGLLHLAMEALVKDGRFDRRSGVFVRWRHGVGCQVRRHGAAKVATLGEEAARKFQAGEALGKADVKM